jgi:hypothetical protein
MSLQIEIKFLPASEVLSIRQRVLRPLARPQDCSFVNDHEASNFHLGLFHNQKLVSVASFLQEASPTLSAGYPFRLRGMATHENYRGQGLAEIFCVLEFMPSRKDAAICSGVMLAFELFHSISPWDFSSLAISLKSKKVDPIKSCTRSLFLARLIL